MSIDVVLPAMLKGDRAMLVVVVVRDTRHEYCRRHANAEILPQSKQNSRNAAQAGKRAREY